MTELILDATGDKIFFMLINNKDIYKCSHENSKTNYEKLVILINKFLNKNNYDFSKIKSIYINSGPGSFAGIRNSLSVVKALYLTRKIQFYCFSLQDFENIDKFRFEDVPKLCKKNGIKKNFLKLIY